MIKTYSVNRRKIEANTDRKYILIVNINLVHIYKPAVIIIQNSNKSKLNESHITTV